jgi:flagellar hook assembly protein FlgD
VVINVFTISGKVVKSINKTLSAQGFRSEGIEWDGKDDFGDKLGKGVYIYKVKIKDEEGKTAEQFEKLVILN